MAGILRFTQRLAGACILMFGLPLQAGELLQNGGFEDYPAPSVGHSYSLYGQYGGADISPWQTAHMTNPNGQGYFYAPGGWLLRSVNGGLTPINTNPSVGLPESDASQSAPGVQRHYLDIVGTGFAFQYFTAPCNGKLEASAAFAPLSGNQDSSSLSVIPWSGADLLLPVPSNDNLSSDPQFQALYSAHMAAKADISTQPDYSLPDPMANWQTLTLPPMQVQGGQRYAFVVKLGNSAQLDNASAQLSCDLDDGSDWSGQPGSANPVEPAGGTGDAGGAASGNTGGGALPPKVERAGLRKECRPVEAGVYQGVAGYFWRCDIAIDVTPSPFAGTFTLEEDASTISGGQAQFVSASVPCNGLGSDQLSCSLDGATMSQPTHVQVELFAAGPGEDGLIKWENCASGRAEAAANSVAAEESCVRTEFKPGDDGQPLPEPEKISLKKECRDPVEAERDGVQGVEWQCKVVVEADPAPFAGSFSFVEDASNLTGGTGQIVGYSANPAWTCAPMPANTSTCTISGADFSPTGQEVLSFDLFAATSGEALTWENCVEGMWSSGPRGEERPAQEVRGNCERMEWPDKPVPPDPVAPSIEKTCTDPVESEHNGNSGLLWNCEITVTVASAPFNGYFLLVEDASNLTGATGGEIIGTDAAIIGSGGLVPGWNCGPLPDTDPFCLIAGADFDPSGTETISFDLFLPLGGVGDGDISWENCAYGAAVGPEPASWESEFSQNLINDCESLYGQPDLPTSNVEKTCTDPVPVYEGGTLRGLDWSCTVTINVQPAPFAGTFSLIEDASNLTGGNGQIFSVSGTNSGWSCAPVPANIMTCTISGADFSPTGQEVLNFYLHADMTGTAGGPVSWENCASGNLNLQGGAKINPPTGDDAEKSCVTMTWAPEQPEPSTFDITKKCEASGDRMEFSDTAWMQPWRCMITVTADPVPFSGPLEVIEDLLFGTNSAPGQIVSMTSADPWACNAPAYSATNLPACQIDGSQFPASGVSTIQVDLMLLGAAADLFGAENCVELSHGKGQGELVGRDCVSIADPKPVEPEIDVSKSCAAPERGADGLWHVACTLTLSGSNLPAGETIRISDEMLSSGSMQALSGSITPPPGLAQYCGTYPLAGGVGTACDIPASVIAGAGGTLSLPFEGTFSGSGGTLFGQRPAQNCVRAENSSGTLVAPAQGAFCVPLEFALSATKPDWGRPGGTGDAGSGGNAPDCGVDVLFVLDRSGSMNQDNRIAMLRSGVQMAMNALDGNGSRAGLVIFNDSASALVNPPELLPSANMMAQVASLSAYGGTDWAAGLQLAEQIVTNEAEKPLVIFLTDGVSNGSASSAQSAINNIRAQNSRVIGIKLGNGSVTQLAGLLGQNIAYSASNDPVDPFTTDVIKVAQASKLPGIFRQIARAYCPTQPPDDIEQIVDLRLPITPYAGDDEPGQPAPQSAAVLTLDKRAIGACKPDAARRQVHCGFRIELRNDGPGSFEGPLVVVDRPGSSPAPVAVRASGGGWECDRLRGGEITCVAPGLSLAPGQSSSFELRVSLPGETEARPWENCAITGVPQGHRARVALAQRLMNERGLNAGPVDGVAGPRTYHALAQLRARLGLPDRRSFDDELFASLGLATDTQRACATVQLPALPERAPQSAPSLQRCHRATTRAIDGGCACSDPEHMVRRSPTRCACRNGLPPINGKCWQFRTTPGGRNDAPRDTSTECRYTIGGACL